MKITKEEIAKLAKCSCNAYCHYYKVGSDIEIYFREEDRTLFISALRWDYAWAFQQRITYAAQLRDDGTIKLYKSFNEQDCLYETNVYYFPLAIPLKKKSKVAKKDKAAIDQVEKFLGLLNQSVVKFVAKMSKATGNSKRLTLDRYAFLRQLPAIARTKISAEDFKVIERVYESYGARKVVELLNKQTDQKKFNRRELLTSILHPIVMDLMDNDPTYFTEKCIHQFKTEHAVDWLKLKGIDVPEANMSYARQETIKRVALVVKQEGLFAEQLAKANLKLMIAIVLRVNHRGNFETWLKKQKLLKKIWKLKQQDIVGVLMRGCCFTTKTKLTHEYPKEQTSLVLSCLTKAASGYELETIEEVRYLFTRTDLPNKEDIIKRLRHLKDGIPVSNYISLMIADKKQLLPPAFYENAENMRGGYALIHINTIYRLLDEMGQDTINLKDAKNLEQLNAIRNRFEADTALERKARADKEFKLPYKNLLPVPEVKNEKLVVKALISPYEVHQEGEEMHHCVANYADNPKRGCEIFFKVEKPERATLRIRKGYGNNLEINDFRGVCNKDVSRETWSLVREWITQPIEKKEEKTNG